MADQKEKMSRKFGDADQVLGRRLVDTSEAMTQHLAFDMKGLDQCDKHQKVLEFFCKDESKLCCSTCAFVDHRKCHCVVEIPTIAERSVSTSSKLIVKLRGVKSKAEKTAKYVKSSKQQLDQNIKEIFLKIRKMREKVIQMFDDLETSVAKDAESFETTMNEKLIQKHSVNEKHIDSAIETLETIDNVYKNGTPSQKFIVEQKMKKHVDELCRNVDRQCQMLETVTVAFDFDDKLKLPPLPMSDYVPGQLTLKYYIPEADESIALNDPIFKLTKITSIDLKKKRSDVGEPLYSGLDFLRDGRLVAVDNYKMKCLIYNEKLQKVGSHKFSYNPLDVVVISKEEVAVTSDGEYKIDFLRVSKSNEITLIKTCEVKTQYYSISLKDEVNFLVGTVNDTKPVRIVSLSGEEKNLSIGFPNKKYPNDASTCAYIGSKVVLVDRYKHTVYIYDTETNTRVVVKDDKIKEPFGVAIGPSACILVCSNRTNSIVQISQTGRILTSYKLDMEKPYRVSVSKDKSVLAVTDNVTGGRKLQMYKMTY